MALTRAPGYIPLRKPPKLPIASVQPKRGPVVAAPPGFIAGPAADQPGYVPPGGVGYVPPGGNVVPATAGTVPALPRVSAISPSYSLELTSDPLYQQTVDAYTSALEGARGSLRNQIRAAVLGSGFDIRGQLGQTPDLAQYGGDIDEATALAAAQNPLSAKALLDTARARNLSNLDYALAARGTLGSGAAATGATGITEDYQQRAQAQMSDLLDAIRGGAGEYANLVSAQTTAKNQALQAIADRLAQRQGPVYTDGTFDTGAVDLGGGAVAPPPSAAPPRPAAPPPQAQKGPVNWGGRSFTTKQALDQYLRRTPGGYANFMQWELDHPDAARRLR